MQINMIVLQAGIAAGFLSIIALIIILIVSIPLLGLQVRKVLLKIFPVGSNTKREFWIYVGSILIAIPLTILLLFILLLLFLLIL